MQRLRDEGLSNRQIAAEIGKGTRTVDRALAAPKGKPSLHIGRGKAKGRVLREEFMAPLGMSVRTLAHDLGVPADAVRAAIVAEHRAGKS